MEVPSKNLIHILQQCLNYVDPRLIDHGTRVAYLIKKMLQTDGKYDVRTQNQIILLAVLHDIGAYKTDEIDRMVEFETGDVWKHSVYGYLFLRHLTPLTELAPAVLFHHTDYAKLSTRKIPYADIAQLLFLADRTDIYTHTKQRKLPEKFLDNLENRKFSPETIALFNAAERKYQLTTHLLNGTYKAEMQDIMQGIAFSQEEVDKYLKMIVYAIDFRSYHTVIHTIMTMSISLAIGEDSGLTATELERLNYGALLHDIGKIAIPVEILEYPGKLTPKAMETMRTHVSITKQILEGYVDDAVLQIAIRHHEKIDGSGYPQGLKGYALTKSQRIIAIADILSALSGTRSYKTAFEKEKIVRILQDMADEGLLCPVTVATVLENYDSIMERAESSSASVLHIYNGIQEEYQQLYSKCRAL